MSCPPVGTVFSTTGSGPDVVYLLNLSSEKTITTSLCGNTWDTSIGIFNSDGTIFAVDDDACTGVQSEITCTFPAGDYFIVISGWGSGAGDYELNIFESSGKTIYDKPISSENSSVDYIGYKIAFEQDRSVILEDFGYVESVSIKSNSNQAQFSSECGNLLGFIIYQDSDSIDFTTETNYIDTGLTNEVEYCYNIAALYEEGISDTVGPVCATPETLSVASLPISTDFEGGLDEGWRQEVSDGAPTEWSFSTNGDIPPSDGNYAWINDDEVGSGTPSYVVTLHTPFFSTTDGGIIIISFDYIWNELGDLLKVMWRIPNGEWQLLNSLTKTLTWTTMTLEATDEIGELNAVQIGFQYDDNSAWAWWVGLDNVNIASFTEVSITGNVSSSLTGGPLAGAVVTVVETTIGLEFEAVTNTNGDYAISGLSGSL